MTEKTILNGGGEVTPDHKEIDPVTGMQKDYVVLNPEERSKGFVRPYRNSYLHVGVGGSEVDPLNKAKSGLKGNGCGTETRMGRAIAETYARDPKFYSGTYCAGCSSHFPVEEFVWTGTDIRVGS